MKKYLIGFLFLFPSLTLASTYGSNFLTGGTATCDSELNSGVQCAYAVDGNEATLWQSGQGGFPHWFKYDLGAGVSKIPAKWYVKIWGDTNGSWIKNWEIDGSNDNSNFYFLASSTAANYTTPTWQTFTFNPTSTPYRYIKIFENSTWGTDASTVIVEQMMYECTDCGSGGSGQTTTTQYTGFMSLETDQLLRYLLHAGVVITSAWFIIKLFRK